MFGQAAMLESKIDDAYIETLQKKYTYAQKKYNLKAINEKVKFFRMRPSGFPTIRLSQLAQIYIKHKHLLSNIIEGDPKENIEKCFASTLQRIGQHIMCLKNTHKTKKGLSKSFLDLLVINTLIPFLFCYYKAQGQTKLMSSLHGRRQSKPNQTAP